VDKRQHNFDRRARGKNVEGADSKQRRDAEVVGQQNIEDLNEVTEIYAEEITNVDREKADYLLSVQSIRNRVPTYENEDNQVKVNTDEIKAFEEWAAMKVKQEGPSVVPVIEGMRNSLLQRVKETSLTQIEIESSSLVKTTESLKTTMSRPVKLPVERDPLAGVTVRPIVIKRNSRLPENWDGPGGTVVLIDKPRGGVQYA
jgi:tRNA pseudouridine55 synthase